MTGAKRTHSTNSQETENTNPPDAALSRRAFIQRTGAILLVVGIGGCRRLKTEERPPPANPPPPTGVSAPTDVPTPTNVPTPTGAPTVAGEPGTGPTLVPASGIPPADGYLVVDVEKCQGCASCMLACSLIHEGVESLSLSRIQIVQDSFGAFPGDLSIGHCRQCVDPACVKACPTGALDADARYGNVRRVEPEDCIGCGACARACPYTPRRAFLAADRAYGGAAKSRKCDLCANAPYHWDTAGGGQEGTQACVAVCPVGAIAYTDRVPDQDGDGGYVVNLQGESWALLGYPTG